LSSTPQNAQSVVRNIFKKDTSFPGTEREGVVASGGVVMFVKVF